MVIWPTGFILFTDDRIVTPSAHSLELKHDSVLPYKLIYLCFYY